MASGTWDVRMNWTSEASPDFSDSGETVTSRVLNNPGIVTERGRDQIRSLAPPMAGRCDFALNNASKDYSPAYTSGPLYGKLIPGVPVRIRTTAPSAVDIWRGILDDLPQDPRLRGGVVRVPCLGTLAKLAGVKVSTTLYSGITTDAALGHLFDAAGLAASEYTMLDTGKTTLTYWWCDEDDAFSMMARILAAEGPGAAIYEDGAGVVTFHSRHYRLTSTRGGTSQATFGNASTEPKHSPPFGYEPNLKGVVNSASVDVKMLAFAGVSAEVWEYPEPTLAIGPGQSVTFTYRADAPWLDGSVVWNIDTTDARPDESPEILTTEVYANRTALTITNPNSRTITYGGINLQTQAGTVSTFGVAHSLDTSASQTKYGVRTMPTSYTPWPYLSREDAQGLCDAVVSAYQEPRATVTVTVKNANTTRLAQQLAREISDRITVTEGQTGINGPVYIERIRHEVREGGRFHTTQFGCEEAGTYGDWFVIGTSVVGTGRVGY